MLRCKSSKEGRDAAGITIYMKTNVFALALILIIAIAAHYGIIDEDFVLAMMQAVFCRK